MELLMSVQTEKSRVKSSALPWFITSRVKADKRHGLSELEQACLALEHDGMPCPMNVTFDAWVRMNFSYICGKYLERYPRPSAASRSRKQRKAEAALKRAQTPRNTARTKAVKSKKQIAKVSGVDVTTDAFLSTFEWRRLRMEALKKYGPKCMCCGATPAQGAVMNVDHIKPRKTNPHLAMELNNLQILCHECNHGKGNWDQTDWRK
jgi:5-methylcytosine-specific restriction endonuclease McrA